MGNRKENSRKILNSSASTTRIEVIDNEFFEKVANSIYSDDCINIIESNRCGNTKANICDQMALGIPMAVKSDVKNLEDLVNDGNKMIKQDDKSNAKEVPHDGKFRKGSTTSIDDEEEAYSEGDDNGIMEELHYLMKKMESLRK